MDSPRVVTQHVLVRGASPIGEAMAAELQYATDDPYVVRLRLFATDGSGRIQPAVHEIDRTLLVQAITRAVGTGAARAWPVVDERGRSLVVLHLTSTGHDVVLELLTTQLDLFLGRTRALVPIGTEGEHLDVDGLIDQLLGLRPRAAPAPARPSAPPPRG